MSASERMARVFVEHSQATAIVQLVAGWADRHDPADWRDSAEATAELAVLTAMAQGLRDVMRPAEERSNVVPLRPAPHDANGTPTGEG